MNETSNQVWQASLAINHLNEVIHDLRSDRDRLQAQQRAECERRETMASAADAWMTEFQDMAGDMQALTERMLQGVAQLKADGSDADLLMENARLLSLQRAQLKAMRSWLHAQRAQLRRDSEISSQQRVSRLNHLSGPAPLARDGWTSSSEWGELSSMSGLLAREKRAESAGHWL